MGLNDPDIRIDVVFVNSHNSDKLTKATKVMKFLSKYLSVPENEILEENIHSVFNDAYEKMFFDLYGEAIATKSKYSSLSYTTIRNQICKFENKSALIEYDDDDFDDDSISINNEDDYSSDSSDGGIVDSDGIRDAAHELVTLFNSNNPIPSIENPALVSGRKRTKKRSKINNY
jgi:hypothetical protein